MKIFVKVGLTLLLCLYLIILSKLILFKYLPMQEIINHFTFSYSAPYWNSHNFIPFKTIIFYLFLADININIRVDNLIGNIIGFIPFGFILPLLSKRLLSFKKITISTFCLSLTFELLQLLFHFGSFDVDDLILNTLGGVLGYLPIKLIYSFINYKQGQQKNSLSNT
ncbi:VanZ family protein [Bacillus sp. FJAT-49705]|uniref:VanZ family protein n=1 Tax=Cytobacillus citreus TaxID=2833586 RepID=A0ABS5NY58_9BACI|nr:VanZ family protein [Cytobacillus citreus]MBS4192765.1 VanZ family protein [Cytobacillus citreus]